MAQVNQGRHPRCGFTNISANSGAANAAAVASQLSFTVYESTPPTYFAAVGTLGANQYLIAFNNNVGTASNVHEIYVDDHLLNPKMGYVSIFNSLSGSTSYTVNGPNGPTALNPDNLPGAPAGFTATKALSADIGNTSNGLNTSADVVGIIYSFGGSLSDLRTAFSLGNLKIGMHVGSIGTSGQSDGFVNSIPPALLISVPEPASMLLWGSVLAIGGAFTRRRNAAQQIAKTFWSFCSSSRRNAVSDVRSGRTESRFFSVSSRIADFYVRTCRSIFHFSSDFPLSAQTATQSVFLMFDSWVR